MFADYFSEVEGFSSISRDERSNADSEVQTSITESNDETIQVCYTQSMGTQTEMLPTQIGNVDEQALAIFLKRIESLVFEELETVADFTEITEEDKENESNAGKIDHFPGPADSDKRVSSLTWNSTGGTLAVGFCALRHDTWCNHETSVMVHTRSLYRKRAPHVFNTSTCVTSLAFHPWEPSILACGLYSGEVLVWDSKRDDDWVASENDVEHTGRVTHVGWWGNKSGTLCLSAGADGRILLHKVGQTTRNLTITERFFITRGYVNFKHSHKDAGLEVTCVTYIGDEECVVGVGGGGLLHISLSSVQPDAAHPGYIDPVVTVYQPHNAVVTAVRAADNERKFATASSDGELRIYSSREVEPIHCIQCGWCLLDVIWLENINVLGVCSSEKGMKMVRLSTGQITDLNGVTGDYAATKAEVNKSRKIIAVGSADGDVNIWRITLAKHSTSSRFQ